VRKWRGFRAGPSALGRRGIHGQLIREAGIHAELEHPSNGQPPFPPVQKKYFAGLYRRERIGVAEAGLFEVGIGSILIMVGK